jgi:predicted TIM-barrel fold metal-dependent hydrolase
VQRFDDVDYWNFDGELVALQEIDAQQTWEASDWDLREINFDVVRPGVWKISDRIRDMDLAGVAASLNFPSSPFGFCGQRFMRMADHDLGLACMRAYNNWIIEEWAGPYPDRIIPCQVTWLLDPEIAANEVRRNAERGFKAVTFSENPQKLGLPSIYRSHWDPFFRACEETETVINLHVGSSSETLIPSTDSPIQVLGALFPVNGLAAAVDWVFAKVGVRFPDIKLVSSEGGIGWVPMLLDRLRFHQQTDHPDALGCGWRDVDVTPAELLLRNFWFTTFYDPLTLVNAREIGVDKIMFEVDYPHGDSIWPRVQSVIDEQMTSFGADEVAKMTHGNACQLYRHPSPALRPQ